MQRFDRIAAQSKEQVPARYRLVLWTLAGLAEETQIAACSLSDLAHWCSVKPRTMRKHLKAVRDLGFIKIVPAEPEALVFKLRF